MSLRVLLSKRNLEESQRGYDVFVRVSSMLWSIRYFQLNDLSFFVVLMYLPTRELHLYAVNKFK